MFFVEKKKQVFEMLVYLEIINKAWLIYGRKKDEVSWDFVFLGFSIMSMNRLDLFVKSSLCSMCFVSGRNSEKPTIIHSTLHFTSICPHLPSCMLSRPLSLNVTSQKEKNISSSCVKKCISWFYIFNNFVSMFENEGKRDTI